MIRNPNYQGPFGNTLLHGAVLNGDLGEVEQLLAAGADPHLRNRDGKSAVQVAVILGRPEMEELLVRRDGEHLERLLDDALEATFPASDPVALTLPHHPD
jgi:ankyrin repeat protein